VIALRAIDSPHLIRSYDFLTIGGKLVLVMELMDGDLEGYIREHGQLSEKEAITVAVAIASVLEQAHANDIIHRDIKPSNVLLRDGLKVIRVADFGIARVSNSNSGRTRTGLTMGTPTYMAPETIRNVDQADGRADIFSLGKLLFTLLNSSQHEIEAKSFPELVELGLLEQREIPPCLAVIIKKATKMSPDDRYQSAEEMTEALRALDRAYDKAKQSAPNPENEEPEPVFQSQPRPRVLMWLVAIVAVATLVCSDLAWRLMPSVAPKPTPTAQVVEAAPEPVVVVAKPEPKTAIVEVKTEEPKPKPVKTTLVAKTVMVEVSEPKPLAVKALEPPKAEPAEVAPDPPAPTTGKVTISGDFQNARLSGKPATRANELAPGAYELEIEFDHGDGFVTIRTVEVKAGDDIKLTCKNYDCK